LLGGAGKEKGENERDWKDEILTGERLQGTKQALASAYPI
jgi:hypothetical protein